MIRTMTGLVFWGVWALVSGLGCEGALTPQGRELLQSGYDLYEAGEDAATISKLDEFLSANARSSRADEAFYLRGMAKLRRNDPSAAKSDLKKAVSSTRNKRLLAKGRVGLGDIAFADGDMDVAARMYRGALTHPERSDELTGHAHYRLGCVLQRQGRWADADVHFDRVLYLFPGTELSRRAARRTHCVTWTIPTAVFRKRSLADADAKTIVIQNLSPHIEAMILDGQLVFAVQVGRFGTYEEAIAALDEVRKVRENVSVVPAR